MKMGITRQKCPNGLCLVIGMLTWSAAVVLCSGFIGALPQLDRGTDYESVRQGFESLMPHHEKSGRRTRRPVLFCRTSPLLQNNNTSFPRQSLPIAPRWCEGGMATSSTRFGEHECHNVHAGNDHHENGPAQRRSATDS